MAPSQKRYGGIIARYGAHKWMAVQMWVCFRKWAWSWRAHHVGAEARGGPITQPALAVRVAVEEAQRSVQQQRHATCFQSDSAFLCRVQNPQDSPGFTSIPKSRRYVNRSSCVTDCREEIVYRRMSEGHTLSRQAWVLNNPKETLEVLQERFSRYNETQFPSNGSPLLTPEP